MGFPTTTWTLLCAALALGVGAYFYYRLQARALVLRADTTTPRRVSQPLMASQPRHYATYAGVSTFAVLLLALLAARAAQNGLGGTAFASLVPFVFVLAATAACCGVLARRLHERFGARARLELWVRRAMLLAAALALATTLGIVLSLVFEAARFFQQVAWHEFFFGLRWSPQTAIHDSQIASEGAFGAVPLFAGTFLIALIAMLVALPIGLMAAVYLSEYATARTSAIAKPMLEILAGIPTVVYGFFAALALAPLLRRAGEVLGLSIASESALAAGVVMGVMLIPFISSLSNDVIRAVPQTLRDAAAALGATKSETIRQVVMPAAFGGIMSAILLAVSRAIGETMIVVMAAGMAARLTANPLEAVTTITVQMVALLVGDQEFDSPKTLAAFALGLVLFFLTLALNLAALLIARHYRERYE